jgi:hypothetical protein
VGEEVEMLEHHADFRPDFLDILDIVGQFDAVDDDPSALVFLQPVDAADQGGFPDPEGPQMTMRSPGHGQVDVLQDMELTEPFVHLLDLDDGSPVGCRVVGFSS